MAKHASVYPAPEELEAVQTLVSTVEAALKKVSDWMDDKSSGGSGGEEAAAAPAMFDDGEEDPAETKYVDCLSAAFSSAFSLSFF